MWGKVSLFMCVCPERAMRFKTGDSSGLERTGKILMLPFSRMLQLNRNIFNAKDRHLLPKEVFVNVSQSSGWKLLYMEGIYPLLLLLKLCYCLGTGMPSVLWLCTPPDKCFLLELCICWCLQPSCLICTPTVESLAQTEMEVVFFSRELESVYCYYHPEPFYRKSTHCYSLFLKF